MPLNSPEVQRFSLAIGALIALTWKDRRGVVPGGIVVPGFLVNQALLSTSWCIAILLISLMIHSIYRRWIQQVDHQRRWPMYILGILSLVVSTPIALLHIQLGLLPSSIDSVTGTLLPGVIAFNMHRQGLGRVLSGLAIVTTITGLLLAALLLVGTAALQLDFDQLNHYYLHAPRLQIRAHLLQFLAALLVGSAIYRRTGMRPGGYMVAPVAAALLLSPLSAVMFIAGCLIVEQSVRWLMHASLIIGLQRYGAALLFSIGYVWGIELAWIQLGMLALPFQGNHILVIIAILSYANDAILEGRSRVLPWMLAMIAMGFATLLLTQAWLASGIYPQALPQKRPINMGSSSELRQRDPVRSLQR